MSANEPPSPGESGRPFPSHPEGVGDTPGPPPAPPPPPLPGTGPDTSDVLPALRRGERPPALRPMRIGEMLDAAITLYRRNWRPLMGIVAFVIVPYTFLEQATLWTVNRPFEDRFFITPEEASDMVTLSLLFGALNFLIIQPFVTAAIARATAEVYMGGSPGIGETYRYALGRILTILWVTILFGLAVLGGFILLVIPGIIFAIRFYFATTVVVVEGKRGTAAMGRSWRLAKGSFWKLFGTLILANILAFIVAAILTIPFSVIADRMQESGWFLLGLGSSLAEVIVTPFASIIAVLLYFDMRIRKEGFDLALMAQELERPAGG